MSGKETTQAWYWAYLIKHPDFYSKVPEVKECGKHGDKPKVYCRAHLDADIRAEWEKDFNQGVSEARTDEVIALGRTSFPSLLPLLMTMIGSVVKNPCFEARLDDWTHRNHAEPPQELPTCPS
ncbi:hypothetical protein B0H10DRAFT_1973562, partial [Mycena sp. CBHHK59/15]